MKAKSKPKPKAKPKAAKRAAKTPAPKKYTHRDSSGMAWRMKGSRPVSSLADAVMRSCGYSSW